MVSYKVILGKERGSLWVYTVNMRDISVPREWNRLNSGARRLGDGLPGEMMLSWCWRFGRLGGGAGGVGSGGVIQCGLKVEILNKFEEFSFLFVVIFLGLKM